jgi:hypothetical protein
MEEVVYKLGISGDLGDAAYWLKHRKPERFERVSRNVRQHRSAVLGVTGGNLRQQPYRAVFEVVPLHWGPPEIAES